MSLRIEHLTGGYAGVPVIHDLNLTIQPGEAVGLIGLNGAGKSTTIKHILGLLRPQKGKILLDDKELVADPTAFKQKMAYIPEMPVLYRELTLKEHLEMTMLAYGLQPEDTWPRAEKLLKMFRLENKLDWLPIHFSKGMQQKVMIVTAFLPKTNLLVIDEPFTGLDPLAVANLLKLINQAKTDERMVLMTTHVLADAQQVVSSYAVLNQGTIETTGSLAELRQHYGLQPTDSFDKLYEILSKEQANV